MAHVVERPARRRTSRRTSTSTSTSRCCASSPAAASTTASPPSSAGCSTTRKLVFEDHLAALEADSKKVGTQGGELDFALLVDGLAAEREQGITIDVAYRFFSTEHRKFIVADTPGPRAVHAQHGHRRLDRRRRGDPHRRPQGRAHPDPPPQLPRVAARHPPRGAGDQQARPRRLLPGGLRRRSRPTTGRSPPRSASTTSCASRCRRCGATTSPSRRANTPWYDGPDAASATSRRSRSTTSCTRGPFRMPVQWVNRPNLDFRGFSGEIVGGSVRPGDAVRVAALGPRVHRRAHRHRTATSTRRSPASRSPSPSPTRSTSPAAT